MPLVKINGITYEFDSLADEIKGHLKYMAFIDSELEQLALRQNLLHIARDQIGQRMDRALVRENVNQSPTDQTQSQVHKAESQA